jgi:hypothetical protein
MMTLKIVLFLVCGLSLVVYRNFVAWPNILVAFARYSLLVTFL